MAGQRTVRKDYIDNTETDDDYMTPSQVNDLKLKEDFSEEEDHSFLPDPMNEDSESSDGLPSPDRPRKKMKFKPPSKPDLSIKMPDKRRKKTKGTINEIVGDVPLYYRIFEVAIPLMRASKTSFRNLKHREILDEIQNKFPDWEGKTSATKASRFKATLLK